MTFSGVDGERFYSSESRGYFIVEDTGAVWECDFHGFRVTSLPEDAVRLVPVATGVALPPGTFARPAPDDGDRESW